MRFIPILLVALVASLPAHAAPPTLSSYVAQARPLVLTLDGYDAKTADAFKAGNTARMGALGAKVLALAAKALKMQAPTVLRGPHGDLVRSMRIEGNAIRRYARVGGATRMLAALNTSGRLITNWKEETVAQLRLSGLAVPLWLKRI